MNVQTPGNPVNHRFGKHHTRVTSSLELIAAILSNPGSDPGAFRLRGVCYLYVDQSYWAKCVPGFGLVNSQQPRRFGFPCLCVILL